MNDMITGVIEQPKAARPPSASKIWLKAIELTARIETLPGRLFADVVEDWARRQPDRAALVIEDASLDYEGLSKRINRYARWARSVGANKGDTVGLIMPNGIDYVAAWLGISRAGAVVALINTKLVGPSLAHCIDVAKPSHIIIAHDLTEALDGATPHLKTRAKIWTHGDARSERAIDVALAALDDGPLSQEEHGDVTIDDRALLIYTSGTTGLPKAASISHRRILNWGFWFAGLAGATPQDRLYDCLPLFHSVGGIVAPCSMLAAGGSVVIAERFSASNFWHDIVRHDCTLFQYIGELCRYLLKAPPSEYENRHRLRLVCGNGLRGDIWEDFQARFAIPRILEFYAATEGNFSLFNVEGQPGAIGRIPPLLAHRFPASLVKLDPDSGTALRNEEGFCIACARGEAGEAIGRIGTADEGGGRFEGYTDAAETEKKILRDVFANGDAWFRTGDLMRIDDKGFFHFVDRIGDTFRWKGENVATSEVNDAVRDFTGVVDATTYGVSIPGTDGRAGMSAIVVNEGFDIAALPAHLAQRLPTYARPVFVRISHELDATETFKQKKGDLAREGFDPGAISDPLFMVDPKSGAYVALDSETYAHIIGGAIRL
ncbi:MULTISPECIES: long-chain-acyl-CoA synthetase [unclassified Bradyrhizobium]|uniref:long-chain-acyl-CoA synthetase n=1 Tax=unclassified Bradyrhizobium TaxID=2631580 RepID=UPI002479D096|nr:MULTISPECIES: long-chain-acyl-CoA synthetase [unclassified Bradyrhizobium]WGR72333.1 long-chain-acyl-CoA synthetase [Bradyrhizobium sp. ISRA426]WGR77167.1 long-chain-acyl-CoA synthetase [Bradyrhizobium sp. ISRA430]WGR87572.1 long-chain-acyl-CoA synthetase [Bradyrhizobium sp. ISRA432]